MTTLWFCLVAAALSIYVVLDGFDLGAGAVSLLIARGDEERRQVLTSIGPYWDGNEVWLVAGGGTLFFAFPTLYASAFSGFYLPLMIVLWLLILRGIAIEFRNHLASELWRPFWDVVFGGSSALLALVFGVALGNVVRGVPIDASGYFFLPLWTDFRPGEQAGAIDWYTLLVGLAALISLSVHGSLWVALKTGGALEERSIRFASRLWWAQAGAATAISFVSFIVQPHLAAQYYQRPWGAAFPLLGLAGLIGIRVWSARRNHARAFLASALYLLGMLASVTFGVYPYVLPSNGKPDFGLTIQNASAAEPGLTIGLWWWIPGMLLACGYFVFLYRRFAGKVLS